MEKITNQKILFVCGREKEYVRNKILADQLKQQKNQLKIISSKKKNFLLRHFEIYQKVISFRFKRKKVDLVFVGFYGYLLVPLLKALYPQKPLFFDAFVANYETLQEDASKFSQLGKPLGFLFKQLSRKKILKLAFLFDKLSFSLSQRLYIDTQAHKDYLVKTYQVKPAKISVFYLGVDKKLFFPQKISKPKKYQNKFLVFYYGTGQPLQGIKVILKAAKICETKNSQIYFILVGPLRQKYPHLINKLSLKNTEFINWLKYDSLPKKIAQADLCLGGHFADTPRAKRVIAGKTFQFLAMQKPTIVSQNQANNELQNQKEWPRIKNLVHFCPSDDPSKLAHKINQIAPKRTKLN